MCTLSLNQLQPSHSPGRDVAVSFFYYFYSLFSVDFAIYTAAGLKTLPEFIRKDKDNVNNTQKSELNSQIKMGLTDSSVFLTSLTQISATFKVISSGYVCVKIIWFELLRKIHYSFHERKLNL